MGVEASVIVEFADDIGEDAQNVSVELDNSHANNLDDDGELKSNFLPTDEPVFLIHHDTDIQITEVKCTDGSVRKLGTNVTRTREASGELFPLATTKVSLSYFNINAVSVTWYGNTAKLEVDDSEVSAKSGTFPCYGDISFSVKFNEQWKLSPPAMSLAEDESYNIAVVVYMEKVI